MTLQLITNTLNPSPMTFNNFREFRGAEHARDVVIPAKEKNDDHPLLKEIRKRIIDGWLDMDDCGFL